MADMKLLPASRNKAAPRLRYLPGQLILLASEEGWGYARALAELAQRRGVVVSPAAALSIPYRRAQLVYEFACELKGVDPHAHRDKITLDLTAVQFQKKLRARYGSSHKPSVYCGLRTLEEARVFRRKVKGIPKVALKVGRRELDADPSVDQVRRKSR